MSVMIARGTAVLAIATLAVFASAGSASASSANGLWYYDALHVQAAHDAGWTGKGVTIAYIENQVNLTIPTLVGADVVVEPTTECLSKAGKPVSYSPTTTSFTESAWHGTNVLSLIVGSGKGYAGQTGVKGVAPDAKVLFYSFEPPTSDLNSTGACFDSSGRDTSQDRYAAAVVSAVKAGATIITTSMGFSGSISIDKAIAWAEHQGVVVTASLPDHGSSDVFVSAPGTDNGVVGVQQINSSSVPAQNDLSTKVAAPGVGILTQGDPSTHSWTSQTLSDGTSLATPIVAGFLAVVKQKYPRATGNQLIQSLITNTGTGNHVVTYDQKSGWGYGVASLTNMLAVDPAKYSDVNPLIAQGDHLPSAKQIANATDPSAKSSPTGKPVTPVTGAAGLPGWAIIAGVAGVVGLLIIVGIIVLIVVLVRRSSQRKRA